MTYVPAERAFIPATTDAAGRFAFDNVPIGDHVIVLMGYGDTGDMRTVTVAAGETNAVDFRLEKPVEIVVTLKHPAGKEYEGYDFNIGPTGKKFWPFILCYWKRSAIPTSDAIRIPPMYPGNCKISIYYHWGSEHISRDIEITPQTRSVEFECAMKPLQKGPCTIAGKVIHQCTWYWFSRVTAEGEQDSYTGRMQSDGSFEIRGLPPGKYRLSVGNIIDEMCMNREQFQEAVEVTVEEGKDAEGVEIP